MSASSDRILDALLAAGMKPKPGRDGHATAHCPAHDDQHPSLSIYPKRNGKGSNVKCHAQGCDDRDILAQIGLTIADTFDDPAVRDVYRDNAEYHYTNRIKRRKRRRDGGKTFVYEPVGVEDDRSLYAAERLRPEHTHVILCEGEKAANMCWQLGYPAVATGGALRECNMEPLRDRQVTAVVDRDEAGRGWMERNTKKLGHAKSVRWVHAAVQTEHADIVEHFEAGHTIEDLVPVNSMLTTMVDGAWLDKQEFPPLRWTVDGIMPEGFGLLVGPPKLGKSWFVADIGLASAAGGSALGRVKVEQRPVLYLALEDGHRRLQQRFRRLMGDGQPIPAGINVITTAQRHEVLPMIAEFLDRHRGRGQQPLIILDTLGKVKPPKHAGDDSYTHDYTIGSQLKTTIDKVPGASLLVVHHTRKADSADFVDAVSGTQGIAGSADYVLVLKRTRHCTDATLAVTGRDVRENEYALRVDEGMFWRLDGADLPGAALAVRTRADKARLGDHAFEVLALVNQSDGTITPKDIADKLNISTKRAGNSLRRLYETRCIRKTGRGRYARIPSAESAEKPGQSIIPFPHPTNPGAESAENDGPGPDSALSSLPSDPSNSPLSTRKDERDDAPAAADSFTEPRSRPDPSTWLKVEGDDRCPTCSLHVSQGHRDGCLRKPAPPSDPWATPKPQPNNKIVHFRDPLPETVKRRPADDRMAGWSPEARAVRGYQPPEPEEPPLPFDPDNDDSPPF